MKVHRDSHLDHGLTGYHLENVFARLEGFTGFFVKTLPIPADLAPLSCGLYGPTMGDAAIAEVEVTYAVRGLRTYTSRLVARPMRPTRLVTVIAGQHDGEPCVIYTAFGGPAAPRELGDPSLDDLEARAAFWATHALSSEVIQ
jgi:hypothetical protein